MKKLNKIIIFTVIAILFALAQRQVYFIGYKQGHEVGAEKMFYAITDTIITRFDKQIKDDSINSKKTVTKLIIARQDTVVFYLSKKSLQNK